MEAGKDKYAKGDKMGALRLWERCLKQVRPCCLSLHAIKLHVYNYDTPSTDTVRAAGTKPGAAAGGAL